MAASLVLAALVEGARRATEATPVPICIALFCVATPAFANERITVATVAPDGSAWMREGRALSRDVREFSGGRLELRWIMGGIAGEESHLAQQMAAGRLDGAAISLVGLGKVAPELRVFQLPSTLLTVSEVDAFRGRADADLSAALEKRGFIPLVWVEIGFQLFFSREQPVRTPEDLRGKRVWVAEGDVMDEAIIRALGAWPVTLPLNQLAVRSRAGEIDCMLMPAISAIAFRAFPEYKYVTELPTNFLHGALVVSQRALDRLDENDRRVLRSVGKKYEERFFRIGRIENDNALRVLRAQGLQFVTVDKAGRGKWLEFGKRFRGEAKEELVPRTWIERVMAVLGEARAK